MSQRGWRDFTSHTISMPIHGLVRSKEYAPHWIVSTLSLPIWAAAYAAYCRSLRVQTSDSAILCTIGVLALALMGKFLDLLYEGRLLREVTGQSLCRVWVPVSKNQRKNFEPFELSKF